MMSEVVLYSVVTAIFVGISAGYLGSLMVLEKMALVGDALSHVALPGLALGIIFNFNPLIGAFTFLFASAVLIWQIQRITKISFEALVGAMFTFALAIGILLMGDDLEALEEALFGNIAQITWMHVVAAVVISIGAILLTRILYNKLVLSMISEELAISKGINVAKTNLLYLFLVSLVVAIGIQIVGTLLVGFLVVVPAIAAKNLGGNIRRYSILSAVLGLIAAVLGVIFADAFSQPAGPVVVLVGITIFAATVLINWRKKLTA
jgi:ABC-type Mn2+/Zn2+ transport system permease subunit